MPAYIHSDRDTASMTHALASYLHSHGVACSITSVYNAPDIGQCERFNRIIWSAVRLALASRKLAITQWECVLIDALHSIRSLLCTAMNATPHERLFNYKRRSSFGVSVPTWLSSPGPVFLRRHARSSKYEPLVEEADLVHAMPNYARVRLSTGRETTVPLRDIAPMKRAPAPLFDAANQCDVALSGGSSLEPENLNSDHAISAGDQQAPCEDTSDNVVRGRNDWDTLPSEDISHDTSPGVDDAVRAESAAQSASPGASANGLRRSTRRPLWACSISLM